jgi:hypothetical protein
MDVFLIPVSGDRYELYCEPSSGAEEGRAEAPAGRMAGIGEWFARLRLVAYVRRRFLEMLADADARQQNGDLPEPRGWAGRLQDRMMGWVAERIAEQRLLWNLRTETAAVAAHPQDLTFEQVLILIRRTLQRDYERHRRWLIIDALCLIASGALALVPGPNVLAYYFVFRVWGHWLSMRGARQGLDRIAWTGRACPPLSELRDVASLASPAREERIQDIAGRLRLAHLSAFFDRIALRHA